MLLTSRVAIAATVLAGAVIWPRAVMAADDDAAALSLGGEAPAEATAPASAADSPMRLAIELAAAHVDRRLGLANQDGHRFALDLRYTKAWNDAWRLSLSDRFDQIQPAAPDVRSARNSLREVYVSWQARDGDHRLEIGRLNVRHGQALGFNPSDFFRAGASQVITTADPLALRANRLGTWMLRGSYSWQGVGLALAMAPQLTDPSSKDRPFDLDLAATNGRDRLVLTASGRLSDRANAQVLGWSQAGLGTGVGGNLSLLAGDASVVYAEWAYGRSDTRPDDLVRTARPVPSRFHQAALGVTHTISGALTLTLEADYNQAGLRRDDWNAVLSAGPAIYQGFMSRMQSSQELVAKRAILVHATYKGLGLKQLDLSGYARRNIDDRSTLSWAELRYHWPSVDGALQWQMASGPQRSEFGVMPVKSLIQLIGTWYF